MVARPSPDLSHFAGVVAVGWVGLQLPGVVDLRLVPVLQEFVLEDFVPLLQTRSHPLEKSLYYVSCWHIYVHKTLEIVDVN